MRPALKPPETDLGHGDFDYEFSIETNSPEKRRELLADSGLRRLLQRQSSLYLKAVRNDEWLASVVGGLPDGITVLYFQSLGILKDDSAIEDVYQILSSMITRMATVGSAEPIRTDPFGRYQLEFR